MKLRRILCSSFVLLIKSIKVITFYESQQFCMIFLLFLFHMLVTCINKSRSIYISIYISPTIVAHIIRNTVVQTHTLLFKN